MAKGRSKKKKSTTYFRKNYAPAQAVALRSRKASTRLRAQLAQRAQNLNQQINRSLTAKNKSRSKSNNKTKVKTPAKNKPEIYISTPSNAATKSAKRRTTKRKQPFLARVQQVAKAKLGFMTWREVTLLTSVGVCALMIVFTLVYANIADPAKRSQVELAKIADAYYIEYYYPRVLGKSLYQPEEVLADYAASGLPMVRLRQLLLLNDGKYADSAAVFSNSYYECDTNNTYVRYYPVAPYGPHDYTVSYNTACEKVGKAD